MTSPGRLVSFTVDNKDYFMDSNLYQIKLHFVKV